MSNQPASQNSGSLASTDTVLVWTAALGARCCPDGPVTSLMKPRQFGEALAQRVAARTGIFTSADQLGRLRRNDQADEPDGTRRARQRATILSRRTRFYPS